MSEQAPLTYCVAMGHVAVRYGFEEAGFLNHLMFWYQENRANDRNFFDGRWWTWNTVTAYMNIFPWWTRNQLRRIIDSCKKQGALLAGNYNEDQRDRTVWYTPGDELLRLYGYDVPQEDPPPAGGQEIEQPSGDANADVHLWESTNESVEIHTALPIIQLSNNNIPPIVPQRGTPRDDDKTRKRQCKDKAEWKPERFEGFWKFYPIHKNRQAAIRAWDKLRPPDELISVMGQALTRQKASRSWQEGIGIPYASTWLNGARWEDEDEPSTLGAGAGSLEPDRRQEILRQEDSPWYKLKKQMESEDT